MEKLLFQTDESLLNPFGFEDLEISNDSKSISEVKY